MILKISRDTSTLAYDHLKSTAVDADVGFSIDPASVDPAHYKHPYMENLPYYATWAGITKVKLPRGHTRKFEDPPKPSFRPLYLF